MAKIILMGASLALGIPGVISAAAPGSGSTPQEIVGGIYTFALSIGGLLAFGAIVYGAIKWTASAGNPSQITDARDSITQALLGLLLLLGAALVLGILNPWVFKPSSGSVTFTMSEVCPDIEALPPLVPFVIPQTSPHYVNPPECYPVFRCGISAAQCVTQIQQ